jgi:hypothetical protein
MVQMVREVFELWATLHLEEAVTLGGEGGGDPAMSDAMEIKTLASTHTLLDRFYSSRVRIRVLIRQYLSLRQPPVKYYVGIVCS